MTTALEGHADRNSKWGKEAVDRKPAVREQLKNRRRVSGNSPLDAELHGSPFPGHRVEASG